MEKEIEDFSIRDRGENGECAEYTKEILRKMGERIRILRIREYYQLDQMAFFLGISRTTLWKIEKGDPSVSIGKYAMVLHELRHRDDDFNHIAKLTPAEEYLRENDPYKNYIPRRYTP